MNPHLRAIVHLLAKAAVDDYVEEMVVVDRNEQQSRGDDEDETEGFGHRENRRREKPCLLGEALCGNDKWHTTGVDDAHMQPGPEGYGGA
jgi:hypothetical protein